MLEPCPAYILAGGLNSRFGSDKGRITIAGQPLLQQLVAKLQFDGHQVNIVADRANRYADLGIEAIVDIQANCGPMAGLATALTHREETSGHGWLLVVTCDQIRWHEKWFQSLTQHATGDCDAVMFCGPAVQPLPGLYHTRVRPHIEQSLQSEQYSLKRLLEVRGRVAMIKNFDDNPRRWAFNTAEELITILSQNQAS